MLSEAKHLWIFRMPNWKEWPEILRSAQDGNCATNHWPFLDLERFTGLN